MADTKDLTQMPEVLMPGESPHGALHECVQYVTKLFMEPHHLGQVHKCLSKTWQGAQALSAAVKLMEQYGVHFTKEEEAAFLKKDESQQINWLINKMPETSNEQFQHFFLQLQLIVSTAARIKTALELGKCEDVKTAIEDAERTGVAQFILKMAIVQAGTEVRDLKESYYAWMKSTDQRMKTMLKGQEELVQLQNKLTKAQTTLLGHQAKGNEKAKKVLMGFLAGGGEALKKACFAGWKELILQLREENAIREEYEERLVAAEKRLVDYRMKQLDGISGIINKKGEEQLKILKQEVFDLIKQNVVDEKTERETQDALKALNDKMANFSSAQSDNAKKVVERMNAGRGEALVAAVFKAFVDYHQFYQREKETEEAVKRAEQQVNKFLKEKGDNAKGVMARLSSGSDAGLVGTCMKAWVALYLENKAEQEMLDIVNGESSKHANAMGRNKQSADAVMRRAKFHQDQMMYLRFWNAWLMDTRVEGTLRKYHTRINTKKEQLQTVQRMFRDFAVQLESGLKSDKDSARDLTEPMPKKRMKSEYGSVSLPDIHKPPRSGRAEDDYGATSDY
eukprot:gnl/TRDRNA2_/TRDRNA2_179898_c0_seq1.p1 gnl/TRDRNA2_/TRDRNA2_179898_c0~~gnl/TRDRNA2_/TRDRNA2_179898_c0_seq1.p1  ORF type:complete len:566 (+),score=172.85 gnl/TRDRNA2_/TRDRNA2_179898_c0_seq1:69-1766(+)